MKLYRELELYIFHLEDLKACSRGYLEQCNLPKDCIIKSEQNIETLEWVINDLNEILLLNKGCE